VEVPVSGAPKIDTSVAHPARRYNYWLGGKDHFAADRASGDEIARVQPTVRAAVLENRRFQRRAVRYLAAQQGIDQFLDIGTGIPAPDNTHEVAQAVIPEARIVYVDNDPIVLTHARALLTSTPAGRTAYIDADLREPDKILNHPDLLTTLDLDRPVGLLLIAILHFITDDEDPYGIVRRLLAALPSGSHVVITHITQDYMPPAMIEQVNAAAASGRHGAIRFRTRDEITRFFDGVDLMPPGVGPISDWQPDDDERPAPEDIGVYGGIARLG
jgi:hypothetical protein